LFLLRKVVAVLVGRQFDWVKVAEKVVGGGFLDALVGWRLRNLERIVWLPEVGYEFF